MSERRLNSLVILASASMVLAAAILFTAAVFHVVNSLLPPVQSLLVEFRLHNQTAKDLVLELHELNEWANEAVRKPVKGR